MFRRRLNILTAAFLLVGLILVARLAQLQLLLHSPFDARAGGNRTIETVRGGIYTRWGTPLAQQVPSFDLAVDFQRLKEREWRGQISTLCGVPQADLAATAEEIIQHVERMEAAVRARQMREEGRADIRVAERYQPHRVLTDVPSRVAAAVRAAPDRFPDIRVLEGTRRCYPNGALAPHVVGMIRDVSTEDWQRFCAEDRHWTMGMGVERIGSRYRMDDRVGESGLEKHYESLLRGRRGYVKNRLVFRMLRVDREATRVPPRAGSDIYLTIREDFQRACNRALQRAAAGRVSGIASGKPIQFERGALVLLDVDTGGILAAATYPSYDLSTYREKLPELARNRHAPLFSRPLQGVFPTGSVYKIVTAIAGLETGGIAPGTTFTCRGREKFHDEFRSCTGRHGTLSLVPAIEHSCNIYFYHAGLAAGGKALAQWGRRFGLGSETGVDWPFEKGGWVPDARATFQVINLSIGQGRLGCTPLQVVRMMAAVANGGRLCTPHFLHHTRDASGAIARTFEPEFTRVPVSEESLRTVREGMRLVVRSGTARYAGLDAFRVAGKTGTAELESTELNHAWFAGYAPYDDPRIAFAVVNERVPGGHGGSDAAPILAEALREIWPEVEAMP